MGKTNMDLTLKFIENGKHRFCDACHLSCDDCTAQCDYVGHFEYKKEVPEKIQTEYEWKKERLDLLNSIDSAEVSVLGKEAASLYIWLKENKPENWQTCTKKNTKVGDEVRARLCQTAKRMVNYISNERVPFSVVQNDSKLEMWSILSGYEININR